MNFIKKILKSRTIKDEIFFASIQKMIGFKPNKLKYYKKAFTHSSIRKTTSAGKPVNYERLEFLGDAILSSV